MTTGDSASLGERVSRLEGVSEHFATKEDIARFEGKMTSLENKIDAMEMRLLIRLGGLIVVAVGIVVAIEKFWS
jgi:hypothetical protein